MAFGTALAKIAAEPLFAGLTPAYAGLYQINVVVPSDTPKGPVDLLVSVGEFASNTLTLYVQ